MGRCPGGEGRSQRELFQVRLRLAGPPRSAIRQLLYPATALPQAPSQVTHCFVWERFMAHLSLSLIMQETSDEALIAPMAL